MAILSNDAALKHAKELTSVAIEHNLIARDNDPSKSAENVYAFYKTLYEKLSGKSAD